MTFKAKSQLRVLVEDFGEIVKHELGIVAQISLADNKFGRIEVLFDLFNLLYIQSIADYDYLFDNFSIFPSENKQGKKAQDYRCNNSPQPARNALLRFRRDIAVKIFQTESAFSSTFSCTLKISDDDAVLPCPCSKTLERGLCPHRNDSHFLAVSHGQQFILTHEKPTGSIAFLIRKCEIPLHAAIRIETVREGFLEVFHFRLRIHGHVGMHDSESRTVLRLSVNTDACACDIRRGSLDALLQLLVRSELTRLGLSFRFICLHIFRFSRLNIFRFIRLNIFRSRCRRILLRGSGLLELLDDMPSQILGVPALLHFDSCLLRYIQKCSPHTRIIGV